MPEKEDEREDEHAPNRKDFTDVPDTDKPQFETIEDDPIKEPASATGETVKKA